MSKRLELLTKIAEEAKIRKMAQEAGAGLDEVDQSTADKLAKDIFDKLFEEELAKLLQS